MATRTPPSTPFLAPSNLTGQEITVMKVSEEIITNQWNGRWITVSVSAHEAESETSQPSQEKSDAETCDGSIYADDAYGAALDPTYLPRHGLRQCEKNVDYSPAPRGERRDTVHNAQRASRKARDQFLRHAVFVVCSVQQPDFLQVYPVLDCTEQRVKRSYLADLDALTYGQSSGHSRMVGEGMIFELLRVLHCFMDQFENLLAFLRAVIDQDHCPSRCFDGCFDQDFSQRVHVQAYVTAAVSSWRIEVPEITGVDVLDWWVVPRQEELSPEELRVDGRARNSYDPPSGAKNQTSTAQSRRNNHLQIVVTREVIISTATRNPEDTMPFYVVAASSFEDGSLVRPPCPRQYTLVQVLNMECKDTLRLLDDEIWSVHEVPCINELIDGSWDMVVLKSHCSAFQRVLREVFSSSQVDLRYDPVKPTIAK